MSLSWPCVVCGAQPDEPCRHLRTGKPIKNEHRDGKRYPYLQVRTLTFDDLTAVLVRDGIIEDKNDG
jgi:hypothetical protein